MDPIERQLRELTRESPRIAEELEELQHPRGEMDVWGADDEGNEETEDDGDDER